MPSPELPTSTQRQVGNLLRTWTSCSIRRSPKPLRAQQLLAAKKLARIPGQTFPTVGYRIIDLDTSKVKDLKGLLAFLDKSLPESFATTLRGLKSFERNASGGYFHVAKAGQLALQVSMPANQWMFNLNQLVARLGKDELKIEDKAGFSLKEYLGQTEAVARPGALKSAFLDGRVLLIGYAAPGKSVKWLTKPRHFKL